MFYLKPAKLDYFVKSYLLVLTLHAVFYNLVYKIPATTIFVVGDTVYIHRFLIYMVLFLPYIFQPLIANFWLKNYFSANKIGSLFKIVLTFFVFIFVYFSIFIGWISLWP